MRPPSAAQSRAGAVAPAPRGFPVVACPDSIARDTRCLLLTHTSITTLVGPGAAVSRDHGSSGPVAFSADGRFLASDGGYNQQVHKQVVIWDVATWQPVRNRDVP